MKVHASLRYFLLGLVFLVFCCKSPKADKLTIATASHMHYPMQELAKAFTAHRGIPCDIITGSSGKLTAQIMEGAPYDIFLGANMKYPQEVFKKGKAVNSPKIYGYGKLVLWTMNIGITPQIDSLISPSINHIALANPKTAPYGKAAWESLTYHGMVPQLDHKLVYGESIAQTNQFIFSRAADIGFTALSVVLSPNQKGQGKWRLVDERSYNPLEQGVVVIKQDNTDISRAMEFIDFLDSETAKKILTDFGFKLNE